MLSTTPAFNLKAVLKETGLAADTLRAWERRYGLPTPERTPGGHRLYSQRDIETIKWLIRRQAEGLSISRAVDLWNEQITSGTDPLAAATQPVAIAPVEGTLEAVRAGWLTACLAYNESQAEQFLNQAFAMYPLELVCSEIIQRGLHEIGERWYRNEATVQQEHYTSALAQRRLDALIAAAPQPTHAGTILIGCPPGERHVIPALLLTLFLRRRGHPVVYLGADVPLQQFDATVQSVQAALVILLAQQLQTASQLRDTAEHLGRSRVQVGYGGRIFDLRPDLRAAIPAHFLGETLEAALGSYAGLLSSNIPVPAVRAIPKRELQAVMDFRHHHTMINVYVFAEIKKIGLPFEYMTTAVQFLGDNLYSALSLGALDALKTELDWIRGLLAQHEAEPATLNVFLVAYANAVERAMGQSGLYISDWLRQQADPGFEA